jgi:hypothetical protein
MRSTSLYGLPFFILALFSTRGSDVEEKKLWPTCRYYKHELIKLSDQRLVLIRDFLGRVEVGKLADEAPKEIADCWLKTVQEPLELWKKYYRKVSKKVSPTRGGQFLQIENQIALFIDIAIASGMPAIAPASNK